MTQRVSALNPGARSLALAAWPAHPLSPEPRSVRSKYLNMTVSASIVRPALTKRPRAPMRATVARLIFERAVAGIPSASPIPTAGCSVAAHRRRRSSRSSARPRSSPGSAGTRSSGFGEAYTAGDWRAGPGTDLADLLTPFASRLTHADPGAPAAATCPGQPARPSEPGEHPRRLAARYRGPLRPEQRPFRRFPWTRR